MSEKYSTDEIVEWLIGQVSTIAFLSPIVTSKNALENKGMLRVLIARLRAADKLCEAAQRKINIQVMDEGLWFVAITASEEYLQNALRELHAIIRQAIAGYEKGQS